MLNDRFPLTPPAFAERWWVSPLNRDADAWPAGVDEVYIYDVTLRDGEQLPGVAFTEEERVRLGAALAELGVKRVETGLPKISPSVFRATKRLAEMGLGAQFVPQCRAEPDDVALTAETGSGALVIVHTINPYHCHHVFGLSPEALLEQLVSACRYAKDQELHTSFMASDVFRCDLAWIKEVYRTVACEAQPDVMVVTDTVGCATPWAVEHVVREVARVAPGIPLEYHGHNDFGLGTAGALAAVRAGAAGVHTSFNGLGERTGNAATEEVVAALEVALNVRTGVRLERLLEVSQLVQDLSRVPVPTAKPVSGKGIFETESHVVGLIQTRMQEAMGIDTGMFAFSPDLFGHGEVRYLLGKGSGPTAVEKTCARLGITLSDEEAARALERIKEESRFRKTVISDSTFRSIVQEVRGEAR